MFEIGQKVVCVKTHSQGYVREGELYTVQGMRNCIKCKELDLDVGVKHYREVETCCCGFRKWADGIAWISHELFRPLDDLFNEEIEELMNEIEELCPA